ncbi:MAG: MFS transporter, partial [Blastocatellia bacterium]
SAPIFDSNFKKYLSVLFLFTLGNSSDAFLLLRARQVGSSDVMIPLLWAALHVSKSLSSIVGGGLSDRFGRKRLIVSGWLVYAAIYFGFALAASHLEIWLLFIFYGVYFGLTEGVEKAFVADLTPAEARGTAFGLYNLVIGVGALPASLMMGLLWDRLGAITALVTGAALSLTAVFLLTTLVREANPSPNQFE